MKKVLLVDDEYYFRQALKASFPWEANGFIVCGEARDGEEALGKIADLSPDIALVDINMPVMDGLAFAQIVRERNLPLKIIILSGHSEFDYARQAVQLGVSNYLLKPVDDEALLETLLELKQQMERENNLQIEMEQLKRQVRTNPGSREDGGPSVEKPIGILTSGGVGIHIGCNVAMALLAPQFAVPGGHVAIDVRGRRLEAEVVPMPFYRKPGA